MARREPEGIPADGQMTWAVQAAPIVPTTPTTVLVVEDDEDVHQLLQLALTPAFRLVAAHDGARALAMAREHAPALILLDVDLPAVNGFEVCLLLKSDPATDVIPVVFLTGRDSDDDRRRGRDAGAVAYVTKPFSPVALLALIQAQLPPTTALHG